MIKQFPQFSAIGIDDKEEIEEFCSNFPPYSDFNFTSIFCWDTDNSAEAAFLDGNLAIKLPDYITGKPIYSLLGENSIDESLRKLLAISPALSLIPEVTVQHIVHKESFVVAEDCDNNDYIYELKDLVDLPGKKYKVKRNKANNFMRNYVDKLRLKNIQFTNPNDHREAEQVFMRWAKQRERSEIDIKNELLAIKKLLEYSHLLNLTGILVYIDGECVGFSINEIIDKDYAICHFQKAILAYEHLDVFISQLVAKELIHFGCRYVNWEQDLGIPGLRNLKSSYQQYNFLKKYEVTSAS